MNENQSAVRRIKIDDDLVDEGEARDPFNSFTKYFIRYLRAPTDLVIDLLLKIFIISLSCCVL